MTPEEIKKLSAYFKFVFGNDQLVVKPRPKKTDSCEVFKGEEFLGVIYLDEDEGERSFSFSMAILDIDLEQV